MAYTWHMHGIHQRVCTWYLERARGPGLQSPNGDCKSSHGITGTLTPHHTSHLIVVYVYTCVGMYILHISPVSLAYIFYASSICLLYISSTSSIYLPSLFKALGVVWVLLSMPHLLLPLFVMKWHGLFVYPLAARHSLPPAPRAIAYVSWDIHTPCITTKPQVAYRRPL